MNQPMNQPTTPDLSNYGAQVIKESGRFALTYWPYCTKCKSSFQFDANEPFAYCFCGTTEWGDPRPASWVCSPRQPLNEKVEMNDKTEQTVTDELRLAAKSAEPYLTATVGASHLNEAADTIDNLRAQLAEAQKDAERWRYLRDSGDDSIYAMRFDVDGDTPISGAELDVSIDAAKGKTS